MQTMKYNGKDIEVQEVDVLTEVERWNEYQLANGSVLSVKTILVKVCKSTNEKLPDGTALYLISTKNIVKVKEC